jgi:transposase
VSVLAGGKLKHHKIMKNLKNILRCYAMGMGLKSISTAFEVSRNTVRKYVRRYQESGLSIERLLAMPESQVIDMFVDGVSRSRTPSPRQEELDALLPDYLKRLSRKGVTVKSLYEEYASKYPDGYSHTSFKRRIRHYKLEVKAIGHVEHLAGDQMYIDFAGDKLEGPITIEVPPINKNLNYWYVGVGVKYNIASLYKATREERQACLGRQIANENEKLAMEELEIK